MRNFYRRGKSTVKRSNVTKWITLNPLPDCKDSDVQTSQPVMLNDDEFIIAPHWPSIYTADIEKMKKVGLYIYNIPNNKWRLFMHYNDVYNPQWNRTCIDHEENKLYSTGNRSALTIIDLNKKICMKQENTPNIGSGAYLMMIDGICHILGGSKSNKHYIWNDKKKQFDEIFEFKEFGKGCTGFKIIHIKSKNRLLLFCGYRYEDSSRVNEIWSHDLGTKQWNKLKQTMPYKMNSFGIVVTVDEKYAITFGGFTGRSIEDIGVINLKTLKYAESDIKVPKEKGSLSLYHAIKWHERSSEEVLINGFVRIYSNGNIIPIEIIQLIASWYCIEYVFLISTKGMLWKIALDDILSSCSI